MDEVDPTDVVPMDRIREAFDRVGREADGEIQDAVRETARKMTALVERAIVESERPVYATSYPNRIQTPVGPVLQIYFFHEVPEMGRDVDDHETSTVEVVLHTARDE